MFSLVKRTVLYINLWPPLTPIQTQPCLSDSTRCKISSYCLLEGNLSLKWCSSKKKVPSQFILKPHANGLNIVGQQLLTLLNVTCCVPLHTLLHVVGSCCAKFESGQTTELTTQHFFCSLIARSIVQKCWIRLHSSSNIVGATHAHLKGFKAWVLGVFWACEWWQYLSLGDLEQNEVFPEGKSWGFLLP